MRQCVSTLRLVLSFFFIVGSLPSVCRAQAGNGELTGEVRDASQSIVVAAKVTLTEEGTHLLYKSATNEDGIYQWSSLKPGRYTLTVEKDGFQRYERQDIDELVASA